MELPHCPVCQNGHLLPMSAGEAAFQFWVCSSPTCAYVISGSLAPVTYYKVSAVHQQKDKGDKKWTEFKF
jgi:hypothetical protein